MQSLSLYHWNAITRVLSYLKRTLFHGMLFKSTLKTSNKASNVSYAHQGSDSVNKRSGSFHYLLLNGNSIVYSSKKQFVISRSTVEVEYKVIAKSICEVMWVVSLLSKLGVKLSSNPIIWSANTSVMAITGKPIKHSNMKHLEIDLFFCHGKVKMDRLY